MSQQTVFLSLGFIDAKAAVTKSPPTPGILSLRKIAISIRTDLQSYGASLCALGPADPDQPTAPVHCRQAHGLDSVSSSAIS